MTSVGHVELKVGGTLRHEDPYVQRFADREAFALLAAGEYCNVFTSRQMGKSSLMVRLMSQLLEKGARIASVDIAGDLGTPPDAAGWYIGFLETVSLGLDLDLDVEAWWRDEGRGTANQRLLQFFREVVAAASAAPIAIFVDEIDATLKLTYSDDFFTALRSMYNQRSDVEAYRRITFCLLGTVAPFELIKDRRTTPYNVGRAIVLGDFDPSRDDLSPLYRAMAAGGAPGEELVRAVLDWTGGHPFLTLALCREARERGAQGRADVEDLVAVASSKHADTALRTHYEWINSFLATRLRDQGNAFHLYDAVLRERKVLDGTTTAHVELKLSGLVKRGPEGNLVIRNQLYARRFGPTWLAQTRPIKLRAQRIRFFAAGVGLAATIVGVFLYLNYRVRLNEAEAAKKRAAARVEVLVDELSSTSNEEIAAAAVRELCEFVMRSGEAEADVERMNRAHLAFWERRAAALDDEGKAAVAAGEIDRGLVLGALAGVKRGQPSGWVKEVYATSYGPVLAATLRGHGGAVNRVRFLGGDMLASVGVDSTLRVFHLYTGAELHKIVVEAISAIDTCTDGSCVLAAALTKEGRWQGRAWDANLERPRAFDLGARGKVYSIAVGPRRGSALRIVTGAEDGTARVGFLPDDAPAAASLRDVVAFTHHSSASMSPVYATHFGSRGDRLVTAALDGVRLWTVPGRGPPKKLPFEGVVFDARLSERGDLVVFGTEKRSVVWSLTDNREISHFAGGRLFITSALSHDGTKVVNAATTEDGQGLVVVWRVSDGKALFRQTTTAAVRDAEFGPDPDLVTAALADGTVRLWRLGSEETPGDVRAVWLSWQKKFGLSITREGTLRPLWPYGPMDPAGYRGDACDDHMRRKP